MSDSIATKFTEEIFNNQGIIHKVCRIYCKDSADRDDLYQEVLLNAWKSFPNFEERSKFSTWLYRVAFNTALYQNRKNIFFNKMTSLDAIKLVPNDEPGNEQLETLYKIIDMLDPLEKSIVILYLDKLPYSEISEITGLTESNVGVKLNRIKLKMKTILSNHGA